ncbi:MAG: cobalamin biosynthesis protein CbiM [Alphaproteobacteria bacterium]|jgi:nickel transport protein|nr:cobalamin biosynthesis protein CbiM [Alphaproteobacteria bacterium]
MRSPAIAALLVLLALLPAAPAEAHRLRVFATVEGGSVSGYGFFIGGGRPAHVAIRAAAPDGAAIFRGETDGGGRFAFPAPPVPTALTITLDAGDGHVASTTLAAHRFGPAPPAEAATASAVNGLPGSALQLTAGDAARPPNPDGEGLTVSHEALQMLIDRSVEAAVARQIRPLLESYAAAEGRLRFNDIAGGIGMIVGLAGIALWVSARNRLRRESRRPGDTG